MIQNNQSYSFSQNMIAELAGVSAATILRTIKELEIKNINLETQKTKKYSLEDTRKIISKTRNFLNFFIKIHVFYNLKGGTGKTIQCSQLASHLAISGFKVLGIDLDPQGHLSNVFGLPDEGNFLTLYDVIINGLSITEAIVPIMPGLDVVPSNLSLSRVEVPLSQKARREEKLKDAVSTIYDKYDFILIDTNPSFSTLNLNALYCAEQVNFVCETAPFSLYGLRVMLEEATAFFIEMKKEFNFKIIPNKYESKTATSQEVLGYLRSHYKDHVMESVVRKSEDMNITTKERKPVSAFCKIKSIAFEDIIDLMHEIIRISTSSPVLKLEAS